MKTQKTILCTILVLLFVLAGSVSAATYNVIDLGALPGGDVSYANSINDNCQIVGFAYVAGQSHSCRFDKTGGVANKDRVRIFCSDSRVPRFQRYMGTFNHMERILTPMRIFRTFYFTSYLIP